MDLETVIGCDGYLSSEGFSEQIFRSTSLRSLWICENNGLLSGLKFQIFNRKSWNISNTTWSSATRTLEFFFKAQIEFQNLSTAHYKVTICHSNLPIASLLNLNCRNYLQTVFFVLAKIIHFHSKFTGPVYLRGTFCPSNENNQFFKNQRLRTK